MGVDATPEVSPVTPVVVDATPEVSPVTPVVVDATPEETPVTLETEPAVSPKAATPALVSDAPAAAVVDEPATPEAPATLAPAPKTPVVAEEQLETKEPISPGSVGESPKGSVSEEAGSPVGAGSDTESRQGDDDDHKRAVLTAESSQVGAAAAAGDKPPLASEEEE